MRNTYQPTYTTGPPTYRGLSPQENKWVGSGYTEVSVEDTLFQIINPARGSVPPFLSLRGPAL